MLLLLSIGKWLANTNGKEKSNFVSQSADSVPARSPAQVYDDGRVLVDLLLKVPVELLGEVGLELGRAVLQPEGDRFNRLFVWEFIVESTNKTPTEQH